MPLYADGERARLRSPPESRLRPHLDERWQGYSDTDRPRLPHPSSLERQRLPLMELDEKSKPFHNEPIHSAPVIHEEQPRRIPSPFDEDVDDYRILLQRHRLIQQQLAALENQENSTLGDDNIIDETFVDIPVEDTKPDLMLHVGNETNQGSFSVSLGQAHLLEDRRQGGNFSHLDANMPDFETSNEVYDLDERNEILDNELAAAKPFLPFKIKPRYSSVPSIKELSQKDLEQRGTKKQDATIAGSNRGENTDTQSRIRKRGKNRRKRKRKVSQGSVQTNVNSQQPVAAGSNQGAHVDPHNELEARLLSLAGSSVSAESNRFDDK